MNATKRSLLIFYTLVALFTGVDMALVIGLFWSSLKTTGSPLALGAVLCISVLLPWGLQQLASKKSSSGMLGLKTLSVLRAATFGFIFVFSMLGMFHMLYGFILIALLIGIVDFFTMSALESANTRLTLAGALSSGYSSRYMQTAIQLGAFGGAAVGGIALDGYGIDRFSLFLCVAGVSTAALARYLPGKQISPAPSDPHQCHASAEGAPVIGNTEGIDTRLMRTLCLGLGMIGFHIAAFNTLTPVVYQNLNHWTAADFGFASGVAGAGAFLAAFLPPLRVPNYVPALLIVAMDSMLVFAPTPLLSIGACFLIGYSINHLRIQLRRKLTDIAHTEHQADYVAAHSAFYYLLMQSAAPLILAGLISGPIFSQLAAPTIFIVVALILLISVAVLPRFIGAKKTPAELSRTTTVT